MKSAHEFANLITDRQFNGFMLLINEGATKNKDTSRTAPQRLHNIQGVFSNEKDGVLDHKRLQSVKGVNPALAKSRSGLECNQYFEDTTLIIKVVGRGVTVSYKNKTSDVPEKCFAHTFGTRADDIFSTDHDSYIFISANTKDQGI